MIVFILMYIFHINRKSKVVKVNMFIKGIGTVER